MSRPWIRTSPALGASSPPSKCNNVLLPDPEAPTIATLSPCCTSRSTPSSTDTSCGPSRKTLRIARAQITGSLIAQSLRGIHARGAPAWVKGREQAEQQRHGSDSHNVAQLKVGGQLADVAHVLGQKLDPEQALYGRHHHVHVER